MTKKLYISSVSSGAGKTTLALALGLILRDRSEKVGYCKPLCYKWAYSTMDKWVPTRQDAALIRDLLEMSEPLSLITPAFTKRRVIEQMNEERDEIYKTVLTSVKELSKSYDYLILEDCLSCFYLNSFNLSAPDLAKEFDANVLVMDKCHISSLDTVLAAKDFVEFRGASCLGGIINKMPPDQQERIRDSVVPKAKELDCQIWATLPEVEKLTAATVDQIAQWLSGEIITQTAPTTDVLVEDFLIGAMTPETALRMMRRLAHKGSGLITGGDRPEMALAAMETDVSVIILTGNLYPSVRVINRAEERGVPIILAPYDTYTTVSILQNKRGTELSSAARERIDSWKELVSKEMDISALIDAL